MHQQRLITAAIQHLFLSLQRPRRVIGIICLSGVYIRVYNVYNEIPGSVRAALAYTDILRVVEILYS